MKSIPPGTSLTEIDREMIEEMRARRTTELQGKRVPPDRAHRFLVDLESRFTEAGQADPVIIESMLAELRNEAGS